MPADLDIHQHELLYPNGQSALIFGTLGTKLLTLTPPAVANEDGTTGDVTRGREDGRDFGEDYLGSKNLLFEVGVLTDTHAANVDQVEQVRSIWEDRAFRTSAHTVGVLRSNRAGTALRCYGRPRNFAEASTVSEARGYTAVTYEFALIDGTWYSDEEYVESLSIRPATNPGLIGPLVDPLTTAPITTTDTTITVGGTTETWPVVTIYGPVTNPSVDIGDLHIGLRGNIPEDRSVTIDPRPWKRTALRDDGANYAGKLTGRTPIMRNMQLEPGTHLVTFEGVDLTATAHVEVAWRDARSRP